MVIPRCLGLAGSSVTVVTRLYLNRLRNQVRRDLARAFLGVTTKTRVDRDQSYSQSGRTRRRLVTAELGARTFRNSSPHTPHEDVERFVRENFTRDKLLASLRTNHAAAVILENNEQAIGYASLSPAQGPKQLVHSVVL
jgi:hypothetical protein